MPKPIRRGSDSNRTSYQGKHRYEHWYVDNQVYFLTARCRDKTHAFAAEAAKSIFWRQFDKYTAELGFTPFVTTLLDNHYHSVGYLRVGENLGTMMQRIHGSVAKLVNDTLDTRLLPSWRDRGKQNYFDGCLRDQKQYRLTYRYTLTQAQRHGIVADWRDYPHTHVNVEMERALRRAIELQAFLEGVPYKRYRDRRWQRRHGD